MEDNNIQFKIMTWNFHGAANLSWDNGGKEISEGHIKKIIEVEPTIFVLTEFAVTYGIEHLFNELKVNELKEKEYIWFFSGCTSKNGIFIGIKKCIINDENFVDDTFNEKGLLSCGFKGCNILQVKVPLICGRDLYITGCRMESGPKSKEHYNNNRKYFYTKLIPTVYGTETNELHILCGDFNNARCLGDLNKPFNRKDYLEKNGEEKLQINYNLNIIKDTLDGMGFTMADNNEGEPIPTWKGYVPDDHIFLRGFERIECSKTKVERSLSDHDILWAKVKVKDDF